MTAPIPFPYTLFASVSFNLGRYTSQNRLYGGVTQVREQAEARWMGTFTTVPLDPAEMRAWRAFWDSLRGGLRGFVAHDEAQPYPLAYPNGFGGLTRAGGGAFDGTATFAPVGGNQFSASLSGLPAGFALAAGDMLELRQNNETRGLYRILSAVTASGGGAAAVTVEPRINPALFTGAALARFERPSCIMTPDPASWSYTAVGGQMSPATFTGIQQIF